MQKIIISSANNLAAIIKKNKIQEFVIISSAYQINDIYLGYVQKIFTNINAAFVRLSYYNKSGFIHASDTKVYKGLRKHKDILASLSLKQKLLIQIVKEPTRSKGPRVTENISLTGNYVILMPFNNTLCIPNQVYDRNERMYLRALGILIKPSTMGLLFKESAVGIPEDNLIQDLLNLKKQWNFIQKAALTTSCPSLLYKDQDIIKKILRDSYNNNVTNIIIDSKVGFKKILYTLNYGKKISNISNADIQLYPKSTCILSNFNIKYSIMEVLKPRVQLRSGAYIFIDSVEALTIIDVNSGSFNQAANSREAILKTNCLAASEIAYQLQLRNINGIIIIDFIDMLQYKDQIIVLQHLDSVLQLDQAKPQIIQLTELGLVELTRCRKAKSLLEIFSDPEKNIFIDLTLNTNESKDIKDLIKYKNYMNVNTIFFKKKFTKFLILKACNLDFATSFKISLTYLPIIYTYLIPILLYSFLFSKNAISIIK
jgi:ribonuclease E|uniref:Ribonuclease E n=1 Tax=Thorea hispida TaxID=202687 RepID=A0A1C9CAK6_9FLOR|nr:ribonuclease E [Thorea hispida]AOM65399.1 ribonuclease E [Thorea hispida]ARX95769.1 ribonuclease E [Thorea hispida]UNJ79216.1 ribonuclease E [Thorea hispida]